VLEAIRASIAFAREYFEDIEFSAEDAIRTERDFLAEVLSVAAAEGASTLNVPDTVGYTTPEEIYDLFRFLDESVDRRTTYLLDPLPRRSRHGGGQFAGRRSRRGAAGRMRGQRHRRTRRQLRARGRGDGAEDPRPTSSGSTTEVDTTKIMAASRTLAQATNARRRATRRS
jgi:2-isopropylmalate synthase